MKRNDVLALAARVEAATGADRELDALVAEAHWQSRWGRSKPKDIKAEPVTASLDAAMSLAKDERARIFEDDLPTLYQARQIIADTGILVGDNGEVFTKLGALAMKIHHAIEHGAGK